MNPRDHDNLPGWLQPFSRALAVIDDVTETPGTLDDYPLRDVLDDRPKVGDLRRLVQAFAPGTTPSP